MLTKSDVNIPWSAPELTNQQCRWSCA